MKINTFLNKSKYVLKKYSPEILLGTSIAANVGTVVFAAKAGTNMYQKKIMHNEKIAEIHDRIDKGAVTVQDGKKELKKEYLKYAKTLTLNYLPAVATASISAGTSIGSYGILTSRNKDLAQLAATTAAAFATYRDRVKTVIGEDAEKKLMDGYKETKVTNPETGKEEKVEEINPIDFNSLTVFIDEKNSKLWDNNVGSMLSHYMLLEEQINIALKSDGGLVGSEVAKMLGITNDMLTPEQIKLLHLYGWLYNPNDDTLLNHISLGLSDRFGNINKRTLGDMREGKNYIAITLHFDGDVINGVNGDKNKTIDKYLSSPYAL